MPSSSLTYLTQLHITCPLIFKLKNVSIKKLIHCGVYKFVCNEDECFIPDWMMENLIIKNEDKIIVEHDIIPSVQFIKFQPQSLDFFKIQNVKSAINDTLENFTCLNENTFIYVNNCKVLITELRPKNAVNIIDCITDFMITNLNGEGIFMSGELNLYLEEAEKFLNIKNQCVKWPNDLNKQRIFRKLHYDLKEKLEPDFKIEISDENFNNLLIQFTGPINSPYEGGTFKCNVRIDDEWPFKAPIIIFKTKIWHPNVDIRTGILCHSLICNNWNSNIRFNSFILSIKLLLSYPDFENPLDVEISKQSRELFNNIVILWTHKFADSKKKLNDFGLFLNNEMTKMKINGIDEYDGLCKLCKNNLTLKNF